MSLLRVEDLDAGYSGHVLDGVSLTVEYGDAVALLGRNGTGKTTLIRAVCGLRPPIVYSGGIRLDGTDVTRMRTQAIARLGVGLVPQGRRVFGSLTVLENLSIAAPRDPDARRWTVESIIDLFPPLGRRRRAPARTLSGGEQQMLAIGRALMTSPRLLVMDEPTEGLAPIVLDTMRDRLHDLRAAGMTVLIAEQNVGFALAVTDRAYILGEHGTIAWRGTTTSLRADPTPIRTHLGL